MPVVHRTVSGRYVPRTTIWEPRPGILSSNLRRFLGSSPRFGLPPPPPEPSSNPSTSRWQGSTDMPSRGVQGGISWVELEDTGVGIEVDSGVGTGVGVGVSVEEGVGVEAGVGVVVTPWTGVEVVGVCVALEVGVGVEAGEGIVVTPWTGVEIGEAVGLAELDWGTSVDISSAGVAWEELQAIRSSSVMCNVEISIGRIDIIDLFNVTDCKCPAV